MAQYSALNIGKSKDSLIDWQLIISVIGLVIIGLISIYSVVHEESPNTFTKQLNFAIIGTIAMIVIAYIPQSFIRIASWWIYGFTLFSLVFVLFAGVTVYGTTGWIRLAGFTFQPAEFAKVGLLFAVAKYLTSKGVRIGSFRDTLIITLLALIPVGLIVKQPDIGTSTVLLAIMLGIYFWIGLNKLLIFTLITLPIPIIAALKGDLYFYGSILALASIIVFFKYTWLEKGIVIGMMFILGFASPIIYNNLMPHQKSRINTFLNPESDPRGTGYNVKQSILAVGSGGVIGKGYMQGSQTQLRYIPMQWTDFIYSVPTEEFGFIGGVLVIGLLTMLMLRIIDIARLSESRFNGILAIGTATMLLYHTLINIGMVIGLMPVMGIPLPLMSYGGTSILVNLMLMGVMLNIYRNIKLKKLHY
jgi:rod shape determining protein RodA